MAKTLSFRNTLFDTLPSNNSNKESITLIWYDPNIKSYEDIEIIKEQLRQINDFVVFYTELDECITFIQTITSEKIFLIISGSCASHILSDIIKYNQLDSIFIYCMKKDLYENLLKFHPEIIGIYNDLNSLYNSIREQVILVEKHIQVFNFFDQNQKATKDLSNESAEFLWYQLFSHVILRLPRDEQAKKQMIDICREYYRGNCKEQKLINQFQNEYRSEDAIRWYSKQSFVYKLINKALRTEDIDQLHTFRFFIGDLSENLLYEHRKLLLTDEQILFVYRGAKLSKEEFEKLKENENKLISTNGFLSTSRLREPALVFAMKSSQRLDTIPVLFEIQCNIKELNEDVIFADISSFSEYPEEQEILFNLSTAFRLNTIEYDGNVWLIKMNVTNDAKNLFKDYIEETYREIEEQSVAIVFGRLMYTIGQYDRALKYFQQLLNNPNDEDLAWIEFNIGRVLTSQNQWNLARKYYDSALNRMINQSSNRIKDSAYVLNSIGILLYDQGKYDEALQFYQQALHIREKFYPLDHVLIGQSLYNIGSILYLQGKYNESLDYQQRSTKIEEQSYPLGHVNTAYNLNIIGNIFYQQKNYNQALEYYQRALHLREKYYPSGHVNIAINLYNIANILNDLGQYDQALEYHTKALQMREKFCPSGHQDISNSLNAISKILQQLEKYDEFYKYLK